MEMRWKSKVSAFLSVIIIVVIVVVVDHHHRVTF